MTDPRRHAPATGRNRDPILDVLRTVLPPSGLVLEVASGTGEHAVHFSRALPHLEWQPTDPDTAALASISAWRDEYALPNLRPPRMLDAAGPRWPGERPDAVVCFTLLHISPWDGQLALMAGAGRILRSGAPLVLYG